MRHSVAILVLLCPFVGGFAQQPAPFDQPMRFTLHQPCNGSTCGQYILAQGEITEDSPLELEGIVRKFNFRPTVYFDSPGGSLGAGMKLGRIIRKLGLDTYVGGPYEQVRNLEGDVDILVERAVCFSACAYAFLGGRTRELAEQGRLGVHQFRTRNGDSGEGVAQIAVAMLANYLDEMGVDRRLLDVASTTEPPQIEMIPLGLARDLNIDNSDPRKSEWELKADGDGNLVLATVQRQARNDATITFALLRTGQQVVAVMRYSIPNNLRTPQELDEAFQKQHELQFDLGGGLIPGGVATWTGSNTETYTTRFEIPLPILNEISHRDRFRILWDWPNALSDINPTTEFGTVGFQNGLNAVLKNGDASKSKDQPMGGAMLASVVVLLACVIAGVVIIWIPREAKRLGPFPYRWGLFQGIVSVESSFLVALAAFFQGTVLTRAAFVVWSILLAIAGVGLCRRKRWGVVVWFANASLGVLGSLGIGMYHKGFGALVGLIANILYFRKRWKLMGSEPLPASPVTSHPDQRPQKGIIYTEAELEAMREHPVGS